ncbi:hypothetical protein PTUN_a1513 [Pseudoalteromonas tunicata]|nr:hypothetical protein PTUN_a1513 [Pseudoalteromonas tunicata]
MYELPDFGRKHQVEPSNPLILSGRELSKAFLYKSSILLFISLVSLTLE